MKPQSVADFTYPTGKAWRDLKAAAPVAGKTTTKG
jgi:hypothetical protein